MKRWSSPSIRAAAEQLGVRDRRLPAGMRASCSPDQIDSLRRWSADKRRLTIVVPDATRPLPADLVSGVLEALRDHALHVVVAIGLHRPPNAPEWLETPHLSEVRSFDPPGGLSITDCGGQQSSVAVSSRGGSEVGFSRSVVDTDGIVVVGSVELHQYAGFSGGIKAVAVGCASPDTIAWIHRPALLRSPMLGVGITQGNPFREQLSALVDDLPPVFEVQALAPAEGDWRLFVGPAEQGWLAAVAASDAFYEVDVAQAAVVGVFGPKAKNLYQASRGATQLALQASPPIAPGAPIALLTEAPDGLGDGPGEKAFAKAIERGRDTLLAELAAATDDYRAGGGAQRAFIVAQTSARHPVGYVALRESPELSRFGWRYLRSVDEIRDFLGTDEYLRVPDPLHRLPRARLRSPEGAEG